MVALVSGDVTASSPVTTNQGAGPQLRLSHDARLRSSSSCDTLSPVLTICQANTGNKAISLGFN